MGAAFVAGMGMGAFSSWEEIEKYLHIGTNTLPDLERHEEYKRLFELFQELYRMNKQNFRKMTAFEEWIN